MPFFSYKGQDYVVVHKIVFKIYFVRSYIDADDMQEVFKLRLKRDFKNEKKVLDAFMHSEADRS